MVLITGPKGSKNMYIKKKPTRKHAHEQKLHAVYFSVTSIVYGVSELLLGNLDVAMTDMSMGTSRQNKTTYFTQLWTHSCFSGSAGSRSALLPCFAFLLVLAVPSYTQSVMT